MEMRLDTAQVARVLNHKGEYPLKRFGITMAVSRMRGAFAANPTPQNAERIADELNALLERHIDIAEEDFLRLSRL